MHKFCFRHPVKFDHMHSRNLILLTIFRLLFLRIFCLIFSILVFPCLAFGLFFFFVASFNFLESKAVFTDLSFFTVITAGLTKQFSVISFALSRFPFFINGLIPSSTWSCKCIGIGLPICCINFASSFRFIFTERFSIRYYCRIGLRIRFLASGFCGRFCPV